MLRINDRQVLIPKQDNFITSSMGQVTPWKREQNIWIGLKEVEQRNTILRALQSACRKISEQLKLFALGLHRLCLSTVSHGLGRGSKDPNELLTNDGFWDSQYLQLYTPVDSSKLVATHMVLVKISGGMKQNKRA